MIDCGAQIYVTDTLPFKPHGRVIALGLFDGLHMGHIDIIKKTVRLSAAHNLTPMVQTFTGLVKNSRRRSLHNGREVRNHVVARRL